MSYDVLIKNGTVVDGAGTAPVRADVAIAGGKIVAIGKVTEGAKRTIDASDLIVSPGFIDPHTHYDAQVCWDPLFTCSSWHGVTSHIMGNCGVGLAPCKPETREIAAWDLVNVEAIPFEVLAKGVTWDWTTFPEYMNAAQKRGVGLNVGFMAPLTPFRHFVMGEESMERSATPEETVKIAALLREALTAGAMGLSTTNGPQHIGYQGRPLACRLSSREELTAYCNVLRDLGRGVIELALNDAPSYVSESDYDLLNLLLTESKRPVTWLALLNRDDKPDMCQDTLRQTEDLLRRGAIPQVTCRPLIVQINLRNPFIFANMPSWKPAFNQTVDVQKTLYRDASFRQAFRKALQEPRIFSDKTLWGRLTVKEVTNPALKSYEGKTVAQVAADRGKDALDTFFELAIEDDINIQFTMEIFNATEERIPELITDSRTMIGLSDGGAHVDMLCDAGYCTYLIGTWVREKSAMTLEHAVKRITSEPANFFGIKDRGTLAVGKAADVTIFDLNTIGSGKRAEMRHDLPGGGRRLVMPAKGVNYTLVNGQVLLEDGKHTGALPGQVLRAGQ
jgi:N-acyl-D-aspartate/D-glutamate deacylase